MSRGDKRQAVLDGALVVFGRDGYSRASIDTIAAEAGVSTRTIYNHFGGKAPLFEAVITDSATRVADFQVGVIDGWLEEIGTGSAVPADLERDLVRLSTRLGRSPARFPDHFALIRQVGVEAGHLPEEAVAAWRRAGPDRVLAARIAAVRRLVELGLLQVDDPALAARHLTQLADREVADRSRLGAEPLGDAEVEAIVTAGVRAFLYGYLSDAARRA